MPNQSRTDVAAVGSMAYNVDTFVIAGVVNGDPYYYALVYNINTKSYIWMRGGLGTLLSSSQLPQGYAFHFFKTSQNLALGNWPNNTSNLTFTPFNDVAGNDQTGLVGLGLVTTTGSLTLANATASFPGINLNSYDPIGIFSTGNVQVGYRYFFDEPQPNIPVFLDQGPLPSSSSYGGLPAGLGGQSGIFSSDVSVVFLPTNWWPSNGGLCNTQITPSPSIINLTYSTCDRYRVMVGTDQPAEFYTNYCTSIDSLRGNTQLTDCMITKGYMYYLPTSIPGASCGRPWNFQNDGFLDMTDTFIGAVDNPYGGCYSSNNTKFEICTFTAQQNAICVPATKTTDPCENVKSTPCPNCPNCTNNCQAGQGCKVNCDKCKVDCSTCNLTKFDLSWWAWLILIILVVIVLWALLHLLHNKSRKGSESHQKYYTTIPPSNNST